LLSAAGADVAAADVAAAGDLHELFEEERTNFDVARETRLGVGALVGRLSENA
jgi:hypothetical protein